MNWHRELGTGLRKESVLKKNTQQLQIAPVYH
jgi:hypothetical protein